VPEFVGDETSATGGPSFIETAETSDRRREFPDWPGWALNLMSVGSILIDPSNAGEGVFPYIFTIRVPDTPENREALAKAPVSFHIGGDPIEGRSEPRGSDERGSQEIFRTARELVITVPPGSPWSAWIDALIIFAPSAVQASLRQQMLDEEEARKPIHFPTPNDFLRDARHDIRPSLANLIPALGDPLGTDDADKVKRGLRTTKRKMFPNLFLRVSEVI